MQIKIVTIFPEIFDPFLRTSLVGKAIESGRLIVDVVDLRDYALDKHRTVDDVPYGGGGGMVMKAEPWLAAVRDVASESAWRVLLTPQGRTLDEAKVLDISQHSELVLLCGRYEGIDERVSQRVVDEELSIGDYVVAGGEVPAMVVVEALSRQVPGVVGLSDSVENDSFRKGILDFPHFTRPRIADDLGVPEVLISGDHASVALWRRREALRATLLKRPDLLDSAELDAVDLALLEELRNSSLPQGSR